MGSVQPQPPKPHRRRVCLLQLVALLVACGVKAQPGTPPATEKSSTEKSPPLFREVAREVGLDFVHFNGMSGEWYFPEINGSGVALLDYDNDGDLDVFLVQGTLLGPGKTLADARFPPAKAPPDGRFRDQLWRNDLRVAADGQRALRFTQVTSASGIEATTSEYGMGVATGDFDNDGWVDLYVTNFGPNRMWRNQGDGTFADVTAAWGVGDARWSVAAAAFDYDRDGWLDLYVGNYLKFDFVRHKICLNDAGARDYCHPLSFEPDADVLWHNRKNGRFQDVSAQALPDRGAFSTLGAVSGDFNGDLWIDFYVATDEMPNQLWLNQKDGTFREEATLGGCAVDAQGKPEASMGVDAADFDGDADEDLFMAHLTRQTNTLYVNDGQALFLDLTDQHGLGAPSLSHTGFGTVFFDYDNDGWLDIAVVNGTVSVIPSLAAAGDPFPFHDINQLYRNLGQGRYVDVTANAGEAFQLSEVSRGLAAGDLDNDGDSDLVITNNNGPARVLLNLNDQLPSGQHHWLGLRLVGRAVARDMLGARVGVQTAGGKTRWQRVGTDGSYASAQDPRLLFGLGAETARAVEVIWPDGSQERFAELASDRYHTLRQGSGQRIDHADQPTVSQPVGKHF